MKKSILFLFLMFLRMGSLIAQSYSMEFGIISDAEIKLSSYNPDPQAEAVVLFDLGDSRFIDDREYGYLIQFTRTRRIKILSRAGVRYSEVEIPLYHSKTAYEKVTSIEAFSYNTVNGILSKTPLNQADVFEEKINNYWSAKKFVFPDVREGTIIEYKYVLQSPFHFNLPDWEFQDRIPTVYSSYTVRMIPFYEYTYIAQGLSKFDSQQSYTDTQDRTYGAVAEVYGSNVGSGVKFRDMVHIYCMKNIPAFKDESNITSVSDYIMKMDFQEAKFLSPSGGETNVITTWPLMIQDLLKADNFGKFLNACERQAKNILEKELPVKDKSSIEKCQAIINYVKSKYVWDGFSGKLTSQSPKDLVNLRKGNVAEINLLLTALLNEAGINASPVLLSTRDNGKIKLDYPFLSFFNYVVVFVNTGDATFLADGTDSYTRFDRIPPKCINEKGLIISKEGEKWIQLDLKYNSIDQKIITVSLEPVTLGMDISLVAQSTEYDSYRLKKTFNNDSAELKKNFLKYGLNKISKIETINYDQPGKPYIISCRATSEAEKLNDKIIISPFLKFIPEKNELTQPTRNYPVDFNYASTTAFKTSINIPEGYKVNNLPEAQNIDNDLVQISLEYASDNGMVKVNGSFMFKKAVYMPADYSRLRYFMDIIIRKFNEPVVFEKA